MMKIIVMIWYLYALVATSSYAGEIRSFFINPGTTAPLGEKTSQTSHHYIYFFQITWARSSPLTWAGVSSFTGRRRRR